MRYTLRKMQYGVFFMLSQCYCIVLYVIASAVT